MVTGLAPGTTVPPEVARITPSGEISIYNTPARPLRITTGPDGNLWMGAMGQIVKMQLAR